MRHRTARPLTGAALTLLAIACAAGLGAAKAGAASHHATAKIHTISACGFVAKTPGTYELTRNVTDSGSDCIAIASDNVTLYLDGHTITGDTSDNCVLVEDGNGFQSVGDTIVGGTKAKPSKTATLTNCDVGLFVTYTSATTASHLKIVSPGSEGVYEDYSTGMTLSAINVALHANVAYGFYLFYGADNVITKSAVDNNSGYESFLVEYETADTLTHDTAMDTYSSGGNAGYGFFDEYSSQDTYAYDTSKGAADGFYLYPSGYGPVTVTHDSATGSTANPNGYGFYIYQAFQQADYAPPRHTLVSHNKTNGFKWGFYDEAATSSAVGEKWISNTADNYSGFGFEIVYPTDYVMTGNIADRNTKGKTFTGGSSYGFYLDNPESYYPFASFAKNQAYDSEFGFYSDEFTVGGKGNVAKRNKYNAYQVEISG